MTFIINIIFFKRTKLSFSNLFNTMVKTIIVYFNQVIFSQILNPDNFVGFGRTSPTDLDVFSHMHYSMIEILADQLNLK